MDTDAASDTDEDAIMEKPSESSNSAQPPTIPALPVSAAAEAKGADLPEGATSAKPKSKHKKKESTNSQEGKESAPTVEEVAEEPKQADNTEPSPRSARKDPKRRASLRTVLELMKKDDHGRSGSLSYSVGSDSAPLSPLPAAGSGSPTPTKDGKSARKKRFVPSVFSGSPKVMKREKSTQSPSPRRGSNAIANPLPAEPLFGSSTYHGPTTATPAPAQGDKEQTSSPKRGHRKTHSDDTNLTSSDAETLARASISRGTSSTFGTRNFRSGSVGDTEDDLRPFDGEDMISKPVSPLSVSAAVLPSRENRSPSPTPVPRAKKHKPLGTIAVQDVSSAVESANGGKHPKSVAPDAAEEGPLLALTESFTKRVPKRKDNDSSSEAVEILNPPSSLPRRISKDFINLEARERSSFGARVAVQAKGSINDTTTEETTPDEAEEPEDDLDSESDSVELIREDAPVTSREDEITAAILGVSDPEAVAMAKEAGPQNDDEDQKRSDNGDPENLDPEKQKKLRKEEEKLRKEKEKEEKKIKKEEEKIRKEKEREEKKKAKKEMKDSSGAPSTDDPSTPSTLTKTPEAIVAADLVAAPESKEKDKEKDKRDKDKEKKDKDEKEKAKKEKLKHQKQPKQKKLSTGKTFEDFVLKVYGSREFLLPGDTSGSLNKLIDYDYICKCINGSAQIDLVYVDKATVAFGDAERSESIADAAIARNPLDSEVSEVILSAEGDAAEGLSPYWAFDADISQFSIRLLDCLNLSVEPEFLKPNRGALFLAAAVYYGGKMIAPFQLSSVVPASVSPVWNEDIAFDIPMRSLPREARLCMTVFLRTDMNKVDRNRVLRSDQPLGWVNVQIFSYSGEIRAGPVSFKLWVGQVANPIGTCMENVAADNPPSLYLDLYTNKSNTPTSTVRSMPKFLPGQNGLSHAFAIRVTAAGVALGSSGPRGKDHEASADEIDLLKDILRRDSLTALVDSEKEILWSNLSWCKKHPSILPKLLWAVDWTDRSTVSHLHRLLETWPLLHPMDALQLLDFKFPDRIVRNFAIRSLESMNDNDLYRILLQLTQALKFEPYHDSALAHFLTKRSFVDQFRVGHFFFWQLKSELNAPAVSERFSLLLESYLKSCGRNSREQLLAQNDVLAKLNKIALEIKSMRRSLAGVSLEDRRAKLQAILKETHWPRRFLLPLDPRVECSGFIVDKCRVLGSKTLPLWLAFENAETGEPIYAIYKVGDDLRQDQLTLQMIALMDDLWKREGIDLKLKPYACMAIGDDNGLIEVVKNANTTSNINIELGGVRAVYSDATLVKWLKKHNPTDKLYAKAVETFLLSCAGYSVITFALGFADRHNDNIMLTKQGNLFHIDFGHFLGHYRKLFGMTYVDKAELVFIPQYYAVIGKDNFSRFEKTCVQAYNVIRKHANYFITLFSLMLSSGLPEVQSVDDIRFMQERLQLDLSEPDAADFFKQILQDAKANSTIKLNHAFHVLYQGIRS